MARRRDVQIWIISILSSSLSIELHTSYAGRIPNLLSLFQNSSYLVSSTRSLCLCFDTSSGRVDDDVQEQVAAILDLLTRVDYLCLINTEQDPPGSVAPALLAAVHRRVNSGALRYFALSGWCLYDVHKFTNLPEDGRPSQLPCLELSSISPDENPNTPNGATARIAFDKFVIDDTSFDIVSSVLGWTRHSLRARAISVSNAWFDYEEILGLVSPNTLEELSFTHLQVADYREFDLSIYKRLRKLSFPLTWDPDPDSYDTVPEYLSITHDPPSINHIEPLMSLLSTTSSSNRLEHLELISDDFLHELAKMTTESSSTPTLRCDDLHKLDELLVAHDRFPFLKKVTVRERDEIDYRKGRPKPRAPSIDILLAARTHLPNLVGKGMLSFEWSHSTFWGHETHRTINIP